MLTWKTRKRCCVSDIPKTYISHNPLGCDSHRIPPGTRVAKQKQKPRAWKWNRQEATTCPREVRGGWNPHFPTRIHMCIVVISQFLEAGSPIVASRCWLRWWRLEAWTGSHFNFRFFWLLPWWGYARFIIIIESLLTCLCVRVWFCC